MDTQQLKLLAGLVRGLLQPSHPSLGHSQSLDLIAALPGLRSWPEVLAFPDRVAATELDTASTSRLAFRLKKRFAVDMSPQDLLAALSPHGVVVPSSAPHIWPAGPKPGVYLTTSQDAIDALLETYEDATDGAVVYAEGAGSRWDSSIDVGEYGLWSSGLDRVPSGTLLIVGPLQLDQQSWSDAADRLEMACNHALNSRHRVAILLDTPTPETLHEDVRLMVTSRPQHSDQETALIGVVAENGDLEARTPFARPWPSVQAPAESARTEAFPSDIHGPLEAVLREHTSGLLLFGSAVIGEHSSMHLVAASLALTDHVGPAARIMPRHRSTPAKDWEVPEAIRQLPFLPSIESAYAQGYRRLIYHPSYTQSEQLLAYSNDALLVSGMYGSEVTDVFMGTLRAGGIQKEEELLGRVLAIVATVPVPTKGGDTVISDLYIANGQPLGHLQRFEDIDQFLSDNLVASWRNSLSRLLDAGAITVTAMKKAFRRNHGIAAFLDEREKQKKTAETA